MGECSIFQFNLDFNVFLIFFPEFYTFHSWKTLLLFSHLLQTLSDLSFCGLIKILQLIRNHFNFNNFRDFSKDNISFAENLCKLSGAFKSWGEIKTEYNLEEKMLYIWFQYLHAILNQLKRIIKVTND